MGKILFCLAIFVSEIGNAQNVGIGTTIPLARLHVIDSSVLFSGVGFPEQVPSSPPPIQGVGRRMMWYAPKAAFRTGYVEGNQWDQNNMGSVSFASGYNPVASGEASTALGFETTASEFGATAFGKYTTALGIASTAMGASSNAGAHYSTALGSTARTFAEYSIAIGESVTANSWISTSLGRHNDPIVTTPSSTWILSEPLLIVGNGTSGGDKKNALAIAKNGNIYIDPSNKNDGTLNGNSLLFGTFNGTAEGIISKRTASGNQYGLDFFTGNLNRMSITNAGKVGIGTNAPGFPLNFADLSGDKISFYGNSGAHYGIGIQAYLMQIHTNDALADVAFGYGSSSSFTETMRIKGNGKVGIGINNPNAPLAFTNTTGTKISFYEGTVNSQYGFAVQSGQFQMYADASTAKISFGYYTSGVFTERMYLTNSTGTLTVNGTNYPSDASYKKQITRLQDPLQKIMAINGVEYFMRLDEFPLKHFDDKLQVGLIAQEVEKVLPQAVQTGDDGYKSVDYARVVPLLVEGMKEQQKQINTLSLKDEEQQKQIDELKKLVNTLLTSIK